MPRRRSKPESEPEQSQEQSAESAEQPEAASGAAGWTPRDLFEPYILLILSQQRAHGYFIEEFLQNAGFFGLDMSTLYRTLRNLEKNGFLHSAWEPGPTGPARRVYTLTDAGQLWLASWAGALQGYRAMIDRFFDLYLGGRKRPETSTTERTDEDV